MSLGLIFKSPEGLVLAADSRVTLTATMPLAGGASGVQLLPAYFDSANKLLSVKCQSYMGMVTYGAGAIGTSEPRTAHGYLPEFEEYLLSKGTARLKTEEFAREVAKFFMTQWAGTGMPAAPLPPGVQPMTFLIAGFDEGEAHGRVFTVSVPAQLDPVEQSPGTFGITWGGQSELVARLINGTDPRALALAETMLGLDQTQVAALQQKWSAELSLPIPYQFLPLRDCVNLSTLLVDLTADIQTWMVGIRGVGGEVDVATITRTEGFRQIRAKRIVDS